MHTSCEAFCKLCSGNRQTLVFGKNKLFWTQFADVDTFFAQVYKTDLKFINKK
jgi:hypothetical protein